MRCNNLNEYKVSEHLTKSGRYKSSIKRTRNYDWQDPEITLNPFPNPDTNWQKAVYLGRNPAKQTLCRFRIKIDRWTRGWRQELNLYMLTHMYTN